MAVNKRKILDAARKHAQKGAKERALKEYETLRKLDPHDAKLHLEIGDAYRRWGQIDEAVGLYSKVAEQYKQEGFEARAVAVYKQILNLDPKRNASYVSLSELYQRMGLDGEAAAALQTAADGYHKDGKKREALDLLRRMAALDPTNTANRLKVAELLRQEGMESDAVAEYDGVAQELERAGDLEGLCSVHERILELKPHRVDIVVATARNLIGLHQPERAESFARRAFDAEPEDPDHYDLLCDVYRALGRDQDLAEVTRGLAKLYRERGDEERAREIIQRLPANESVPELERDLEAAIEGTVADERPLPDFSSSKDDDTDDTDDEMLLEDEQLLADDLPPEVQGSGFLESPTPVASSFEPSDSERDSAEDAEPPTGDPEQLFAEANVYLRYGKRDQAIVSLRAILSQDEAHRGALEKLAEAHAEEGDSELAVDFFRRAAERAAVEDDAPGFEILRDRLAALAPEVAAALEGPASAEESQPDPEPDIEFDAPEFSEDIEADPQGDEGIEFDLDLPEPVGAEEEVLPDDSDFDLDLDIDLDPADDAGSDALVESVAVDRPGADLDDDDLLSESLELLPPDSENAASSVQDGGESGSHGGSPSATTSQQVSEDLEEAQFYFEQELYDEAESIYKRILELAPQHPSALLRMGEIAALRGDDPSVAFGQASATDVAAAESTHVEGAEPPASESDVEFEPEPEPDPELERELVSAETESEEEPFDEPLSLEAEPTLPGVARADDTLPLGDAAGGAADEPGFDLAAELRDVIEDEEAGESGSGESVRPTLDDGFEAVFSDFKRGVSQTLSEGDIDTRYDLGIAYKEMGLLEDAVGEFRICLDSEARRLGSLHMLAICSLELGRASDAVSHLEQALADTALADEMRPGLLFELGRSYAALGNVERAASLFDEVRSSDDGFPGLDEAVADLEAVAQEADSIEESEELESFGDLISEAEDDTESSGSTESDASTDAESFETFDDVIVEAESILADAEVDELPDAEHEVDPDADPEPDPEPPRRRKKISFV